MISTEDILRYKHDRTEEGMYQEETFSTIVNCGLDRQEFKIRITPANYVMNTKWLQAVSGIEVLIFILDCSNFQELVSENPIKSRLHQSITQYIQIIECKYLNTAGVVVFLNKQDILEEKFHNGADLNDADFPDYKFYLLSVHDDITEDDDTVAYKDYIKARTFIRDKIMVS